ncbi:class I SAM-dependent methyltransferase [Chelatococcus sp. GCM10030263]|uniref:class I SAM-dependent methyltransferase n=1 Tax=Chelatococcus sp. GCM10030263 TaxID=3273387 RepID=UPI00361630CE
MSDGWEESAAAWIADMCDGGDFTRQWVTDAPVLARIEGRGYKTALDVGCGEGRFCRMLRARGIATTGIDPTAALLNAAHRRDPDGDYRLGRAEALPFADASFDLVVSYLTLIDIDGVEAAIAEMARVLRPGGDLLIVNLNSFATAGAWDKSDPTKLRFVMDRYLDERAEWLSWRGIRIRNWHRPLSTYMALLLAQGLTLTFFAEPAPMGGDPARQEHYRRLPYCHIMEWRKLG